MILSAEVSGGSALSSINFVTTALWPPKAAVVKSSDFSWWAYRINDAYMVELMQDVWMGDWVHQWVGGWVDLAHERSLISPPNHLIESLALTALTLQPSSTKKNENRVSPICHRKRNYHRGKEYTPKI